MTTRQCKLVVLGDSGVGKTTLIHSFVSHEFCSDFKSTIGADFSSKTIVVNGITVDLQIWDTAGEERFHSVGSAFYRGADACLLVYDLTQKDSFDRLDFWKNDIVVKSGISAPDDFPFVIFGNKADLTEKYQIDPKNIEAWAIQNKKPHFVVTATQSESLDEGFQKIVSIFLEKSQESVQQIASIPVDITVDSTESKRNCC